jgi:hypothetical protein
MQLMELASSAGKLHQLHTGNKGVPRRRDN